MCEATDPVTRDSRNPGDGFDYSPEAFERTLGAKAMEHIRASVAAAAPPTPEQVETLRRIFAPTVARLAGIPDKRPSAGAPTPQRTASVRYGGHAVEVSSGREPDPQDAERGERMTAVAPGWVWDQVSDLDYDHAAQVLRLPVGWLKEKAPRGDIPRTQYGKHIRFTPDDIREIRRMHRQPARGRSTPVVEDSEVYDARLRAALVRAEAS